MPTPFAHRGQKIVNGLFLLGGQPRTCRMRITVRRVLEILATYPGRLELFKDYPDLQQALEFAAATVDGTIDLQIDAA
ncbi:MAG: DUF433 domain-containing protein [Bryobacteraceae bacterium]